MIWFSSDSHFGHRNIIQYCNRPFQSVDEMNEGLVSRWNERVSDEDTVYYLGDFSLSRSKIEYAKRLRGKKILIAGNHDACFNGHKNFEKSIQYYIDAGFAEIHNGHYELMRPRGEVWLLSHFPYKQNPIPVGYDQRYWEHRLEDKGQWLLHGHIHGVWKIRNKMIDVGCDSWNCYPVSEIEIEELMNGSRDKTEVTAS